MLTDIERWDRKYRNVKNTPPAAPDEVLSELATWLNGEGWALDVACGRGANTGFLASLGYEALGIDCSREALTQARYHFRDSSTHWLAADFDQFFFPQSFFDVVVVVRFLDRKLTSALVESLVPGGLLFHRTFNVNHLKNAASINPRFVLAREELLDLYADLELVATNDHTDNIETLSFILASKPRFRSGCTEAASL